MKPTRINDLSRVFSAHRHSGRQTLSIGAAGKATATGPGAMTVQDAAAPAMYLFLQSFESGSIAPKTGGDGAFTVTLEHGLGQTIYFSDRPERVVGTAPTAEFIAGFDFNPESPPNAALLVEDEQGESTFAIVELTNPIYDKGTRSATYDATELAGFATGAGTGFYQEPVNVAALPTAFTSAHLFIDDCHGEVVACYPAGKGDQRPYLLGYVKSTGMCWDQATRTCSECNPAPDILACQAKYPTVCTNASPCEVVQIAP